MSLQVCCSLHSLRWQAWSVHFVSRDFIRLWLNNNSVSRIPSLSCSVSSGLNNRSPFLKVWSTQLPNGMTFFLQFESNSYWIWNSLLRFLTKFIHLISEAMKKTDIIPFKWVWDYSWQGDISQFGFSDFQKRLWEQSVWNKQCTSLRKGCFPYGQQHSCRMILTVMWYCLQISGHT